ncbi:MAG: flagellar biosynthetic protein FliR, partial [Candidatus Margulisbacteria bacterium]|nr:flagellar biosynthetic protein FliR [Candidatus Margulisiibacteriota bacterium]
VFMLILTRIIGLFLVAPLFSDRSISRAFKIGLVIWITIVLWYVVPVDIDKMPTSGVAYGFAVFQELLVGLFLGTIPQILFAGVRAMGEIVGMQMGLSVATTFNPSEGGQESLLTKFFANIMLLLLLIIDGHHLLLAAIRKSFDVLPLLNTWNFMQSGQYIAEMAGAIFAIGISLAAPIILIIFLLDFAFGLVSRVAPQVNVFMLGFQLKPPLGEIVTILITPLLMERMVYLLGRMVNELTQLFYLMHM